MHPWPFDDSKDTAVFTTVSVIVGGKPILHVSHDEADGAWQFHSGLTDDLDAEPMVVALSEIVAYDSGVCELANLPCGWFAERQHVGDPWIKARQ